MKQLLRSYKAQALTLIFVWLVSMVFSAEFLLSLCMILLAALSLFEWKQTRIGLRATLASNWKRFLTSPVFWVVAIPFLIVLLSAAWSSDWGYTLERLRIKLPFLALPFVFLSIPHFRRKELDLVLYFLVILMWIACLFVGVHYLLHFDQINQLIGKGQPIPTPSNHIRFSLVLCYAIFAGGYLFWRGFFLKYRWERYWLGAITLFLFLFIHILSVRSGLLVLYLSAFILGIRWVWQTRRYALGAVVLIALGSLPVLAYQMVPSFRARVDYTLWDVNQYLKGSGASSDSDRLTSMSIGLAIGREHPVWGVGAGDLRREVRLAYQDTFGADRSPHMPHNQLVSVFAGTGLVGLTLFLFGFFFPLFYRRHDRDPLFLVLHIVIFFSFFMENTIENNFGVSFYLLFLLLKLNQFSLSAAERGQES